MQIIHKITFFNSLLILSSSIPLTAATFDEDHHIEEVVINGDVIENDAAPLVVHAKKSKEVERGA